MVLAVLVVLVVLALFAVLAVLSGKRSIAYFVPKRYLFKGSLALLQAQV